MEITNKIQSYKQLIVWQKSKKLAIEVYQATKLFPPTETYGLVTQMRRAAVSIPSNIAEGHKRSSRKDFRQFLFIAAGSCAELETQTEIATELGYGKRNGLENILSIVDEVSRMLSSMIKSLK